MSSCGASGSMTAYRYSPLESSLTPTSWVYCMYGHLVGSWKNPITCSVASGSVAFRGPIGR
jgi:hypothetical protein